MNAWVRRMAALLLAGALVFGGIRLIQLGVYGYTVFVVVPVLIGMATALVFQPKTSWEAARNGMVVLGCSTCLFLIVGIEGLFCILMTLPLALLLGALGGFLGFQLISSVRGFKHGAAMIILLPAGSLSVDLTARPELFEVRTTLQVAAPPEKVWKHVIAFPELPEPAEWYFRSGIAYPKRAWMEGTGVGATRYCEFSTGPFVEPIQVWDEPRLLRFGVTKNPAPMNEWSPFANLAPRHLHGYFTSQQGQFRLMRLPGDRTLLEGTTWYRHGLWPAQYWRWWSDAIIHRIHLRVLRHIQALSE